MSKRIFVDVNYFWARVLLLEDDVLSEIYIELRGKERTVGNIYKGRVENILPGMQAAFVSIGQEKNAFLFAGDVLVNKSEFVFEDNTQEPVIPSIKNVLKKGQDIMVQVLKEPIGNKGARISAHITLPGRLAVIMPTVNYVGVSRRIEDEHERNRLKNIAENALKDSGVGVIIRTEAKNKGEEELTHEILFLKRLWERVQKKYTLVTAPRLIHSEESLIFRILRDVFNSDVEQMLVNDEEYFSKIVAATKIMAPNLEDRIKLYEGQEDMLYDFNLEEPFQKALNRKVWLKNGAYLVIDHTEALTVIDVNTGKFVGTSDLEQTILETNIEAAKEIARQIRLRDISGIIVIDFIDMLQEISREILLENLQTELNKDKTKTSLIGMTQLGLVELTRKKERKSLRSSLKNTCPYCQGSGVVDSKEIVAVKIIKDTKRRMQNNDGGIILITAHEDVIPVLEEMLKGPDALLDNVNKSFYIKVNNSHIEKYEIEILSKKDKINLENTLKIS